jgi:hypothetical protein
VYRNGAPIALGRRLDRACDQAAEVSRDAIRSFGVRQLRDLCDEAIGADC